MSRAGDVRIRPPGDKSITHRALMLGAIASGESTVVAPLVAADTRSTAAVLRNLGVDIGMLGQGNEIAVIGRGFNGLAQPANQLDCGNSGTAARLLVGIVAGSTVTAEITGDDSLRSRPMRRVTKPLEQMGADIEELSGDGLPLLVRGKQLTPLDYATPVASAQVKSALILAGLMAGVPVTVREPRRSRDHTERLLQALGVEVVCKTESVTVSPVAQLPSFQLRVPGDPSSAAFLIAAALLSAKRSVVVEAISLNETRTAAFNVMRRMGGSIEVNETHVELGEPTGDVTARRSSLSATEIEADEIPRLIDEVPVLACLASRATGQTVFRNVGELRVKESNRLETISANLNTIGGEAWVEGDDLYVVGHQRPYRGVVDTALDHRIAMAFATLNLDDGVDLRLSEEQSPQISYPTFFEDIARVTAGV